jgi:hypothetical protein
VDQSLTQYIFYSGGWYYFHLKIFSPFLYNILIFPNFKVLDMILEVIFQHLLVKGNYLKNLEDVSYIFFYFLFHLFLDGDYYVVPFGTVVTGILDMRPGKHDLHFLVGVELLPHAFVNIHDEKMHIGVYFIFIFIIYYIFIYIYILKSIYIYLFIVF